MEINKNKTFSIPLYAIFYCNICNKIKFWKTVLKKEKNDNFMPMIWLAKSAVGCFIEIKLDWREMLMKYVTWPSRSGRSPLFCLHSGLRVSDRFSGVSPRGLHSQQIAKEFSLW